MTAGDARAQEERVRVFNSLSRAVRRRSDPTDEPDRQQHAVDGLRRPCHRHRDLDWRTVPADDPEDPTLREQWGDLLASAFDHVSGWIAQLSNQPYSYNLDSVGYPRGHRRMVGPLVEPARDPVQEPARGAPAGVRPARGNQAVQAALLAIAEAHRERTGQATTPTILVPIPTFSCPLDQIALQGMRAVLLPPRDPGMDPHPDDLDQVPDDVDVDGVYMMPINNPTGRTVPPTSCAAS